jgi:PAS domain S-box-containing protein
MNTPLLDSEQLDWRLKRFTQIVAVTVLGMGVLVLGGWAFDLDILKYVVPKHGSMKANTALCFVLAGAALWWLIEVELARWRRQAVRACALILILIGTLTLIQYGFGVDFGIDQWLFRESLDAGLTGQPGRMGPNTAVCIVLIGAAFLLLKTEIRSFVRLGQILTLIAMLIALAAVIGYLYGASYLLRVSSATQMAFHTALTFVLLTAGLMTAHPRWSITALLLSRSAGGLLLRRMWPQTIYLLLALGWLRLNGERAGLYETAFGTSLHVLFGILLFSLLIWRAAIKMERLDRERLEAASAERATDARLRVTLHSIGDAVIATDAEGRIGFMNTVAENLTGWTQAAAKGQWLTDVFHIVNEQTRAVVENPVTKVIREGVTVGLANHTTLIAKDGRETPIDDSGAPIRDETGAIIGAVLVFRDITERKQTEAGLAHLAAIVESANEAIISKDLTGRIKSWNKGAENLFGYTAEEIIGQSITVLIPPDRIDEEERVLDSIWRGEKINQYETVRQRKDGSLVEILLTVSPIRDAAGHIIGASKIAYDITGRKQAEERLRSSEERMQLAISVAKAATWEVDLVNDKTYWSDSHFTLLGYEPTPNREATPAMWQNILFPEDLKQVFTEWERAEQAQDQFHSEHRIVRADNGEIIWVNAAGRFFYNQEGRAVRFVGVFYDITERKRREANLAFLNDVSDVFNRLTSADEIMQTVGAKVGEYLNISACLFALIDKPRNEAIVESAWRAAGTREVVGTYQLSEYVTEEFRQIARRGEIIVSHDTQNDARIDAAAHAAYDIGSFVSVPFQQSGKWRYLLTINNSAARAWRADEIELIREITNRLFPRIERARAEAALQKSEAEFRQLANAVPQIVFVADANGKVAYINEQWMEFSGLTLEETATPEIVAEIIHADDRERVFGAWAKAFNTGTGYDVEGRMRNHKTGEYRWFLMRSEPTKDAHGNVVQWFGTSTDITASKIAEAERERLLISEQTLRQQAEEANRLKDEFLATISHELRTPLNHMLGWIVMLRSGRLAPDKAAEAMETIERNVRAQNRLVEDLLDVSRIISGKLRLELQPIIPAQVVEAAAKSARPAAAAKGIELQVAERGLPIGARGESKEKYYDSNSQHSATFLGDPDRLQQIVWNLISNAIKFTPRGGRVQVSTEQLDSHITITVSDTGEGIAPEFLPYVFDRFSQANSSLKRKHGGLGLGLAIVRHLVELHGGEVNVTSPGVGQGTTFTITLPLRNANFGTQISDKPATSGSSLDSDQSAFLRSQSAVLTGLRVLVVDEEADSRSLIAGVLTENQAEARIAGNLTEAMSLLDDWWPDVLIADIRLPNGDGNNLPRTLRRHETALGRWLPAIALTADDSAENRLLAIRAGYQLHLAKPVEFRELFIVIASLTGRLPNHE